MKTCTPIVDVVVCNSVPHLGRSLALRFLEWVQQHPEGCVSLPTGGTTGGLIRSLHQLVDEQKVDLRGLHFVQMDEFFPISPTQHNSCCHFVKKQYLEGFGMEEDRALLFNSDDIPLAEGLDYRAVFPDLEVDLTLRYRQPRNRQEELQQRSIFIIDDWCARYEDRIRERGGIGFFMSPIGADGRIAYNIPGTNFHSATRLTETNIAAQAEAAGELGGFSVSSRRKVITIGLGTITYNPDAVAVVYAAGETNAEIVRQTLENPPTSRYPGGALTRLPQARFYLTKGAASRLDQSIRQYYQASTWTFEKTERAVLGLCKKNERYAHKLTLEELQDDPRCALIPGLNEQTPLQVIRDVESKLERGMGHFENEIIFHTGPHHDDIMLGIMPLVNRQLRSATNQVHFGIMTSGYRSVTNAFIMEAMNDTLAFLRNGKIQMVEYPDFFESGYRLKRDKDVCHYLDNVARKNSMEMRRGFCHRLLRDAVEIWGLKSVSEVESCFTRELDILEHSYDGEPNNHEINQLKGAVREFEEELVWAYAGVPVDHVHHLRLGFYSDSRGCPDQQRDIDPVLRQLRSLKPTTLTVTIDAEGIGPDTHYKVMQCVAEAVSQWGEEEDLSRLKVIGYRNVWSTFHPAEANVYVPVSLNAFAILEKAFRDSYLTQVKAEYPSPVFSGSFSELAESIWVKQLKDIQLILGKNFFYEHNNPLVRSTHGLLFLKQMTAQEFIDMARTMRETVEQG